MNTVEPAHAYTPSDTAKPDEPIVAAPVIAMRIFNTLVALSFIFFVWAHVAALAHALRLSILMILAMAVLEIQFYVRKSTLQFVNTSAYAWFIALVGTVAALLFRPTTDGVPDVSFATGLQAIGLAMLVYVIITLNRNPGTEFARRGVSRDGLYRFVRHPIYLAFMCSGYGYILNHTTLYNMGVIALVTFLQVIRIKEEERLLRDDQEFQEYAEHTRWQVIPTVF